MDDRLILAVIFVCLFITSLIIIVPYILYERKVRKVENAFLSNFDRFKNLRNLTFSVVATGKKIGAWNRTRIIDYIIINNKTAILDSIALHKVYTNYWNAFAIKSRNDAYDYANKAAESMILFKNKFKTRCCRSIDELFNKNSPVNITYTLKTYSEGRGIFLQFNRTTATLFVSINEIIKRVGILKTIDFSTTEYEYNIKKERKRMNPALRERIIRRDNSVCQLCGKKCKGSDIHIDHIIPLACGGTTDEQNLQVLCRKCNLHKGKKIITPSSRKYYKR